MQFPSLACRLFRISIVVFLLSSCKVNTYGFRSSEVQTDSLYSEHLGKKVPYRVYEPRAKKYEGTPPMLYLLHGHGGNYLDWFDLDEGNVQAILDSLIRIGAIPPIKAVTFDGENSWYVNGLQQMESAFIEEFVPNMEELFSTQTANNSRIIGGVSAGGYGSLNFAMKYPELFKAAILLSPAAYYPYPPSNSSSRKIDVFKTNGEFDTLKWQSYSYEEYFDDSLDKSNFPKFYLSTGDDDVFEITDVVIRLREFLRERELEQELTIVNGGHDWDVWRYCFAQDLVRIFAE